MPRPYATFTHPSWKPPPSLLSWFHRRSHEMARRIVARQDTHPWLLAEDDARILGYAYAGPFSARPAYLWSVETSVYIDESAQRKGVGRALYAALLGLLGAQGYHRAFAGHLRCPIQRAWGSTRRWASAPSACIAGWVGSSGGGTTSAGGSGPCRASNPTMSRSRPAMLASSHPGSWRPWPTQPERRRTLATTAHLARDRFGDPPDAAPAQPLGAGTVHTGGRPVEGVRVLPRGDARGDVPS